MSRHTLVVALTAPWVLLGPLNIFKVSYVNRGSPIAQYIVVPPAETCQAACDIARMWACLFWGLQTVIALAICTRRIDDLVASVAKAYVGVALLVAFKRDVVRAPVAAAGCVELIVAACLFVAAFPAVSDMYFKTRGKIAKLGAIFFIVHQVTYGITILSFFYAIKSGFDVVSYAKHIPIAGEAIASKLDDVDLSTNLKQFSVAWACAFATAPLRFVSDIILTLTIRKILTVFRPTATEDKKQD